jgi:RHS Repeat
VQQAYSGVEARNFVNQTSGGTADGPYKHAFTYDAWDNVLQDTGRFWSRSIDSPPENFDIGNRNPDWSYDANGNLISRNELPNSFSPFEPVRYNYDAAGRQVRVTQTRTHNSPEGPVTYNFVNAQTFDADNLTTHYSLVRNFHYLANNFPNRTETVEAYVLRSTVLGGKAISEYKGDGTWSKTYVYASRERLGEQTTAENGSAKSMWEAIDPVVGDSVKHFANGLFGVSTTLDPNGVDVGFFDPFPADDSGDPDGLSDSTFGKTVSSLIPIDGGGQLCNLDGLDIECTRIRGDASVQCPNNDCGTQTLTLTGRFEGEFVASWTVIAPVGWDPSWDGTYTFDVDTQTFRGPRDGPVSQQVYNHPASRIVQNAPTGQDIQPRRLLENIFQLLDDNRCSTFVSNLINVARQLTGKKPYTYDVRELAVAVARQENGGYIIRPGANGGGGGGSAYGDIFSGEANVELIMFNTAYTGPRDYQGGYALAALHELIHLAGGGASASDGGRAYYMDVVLADAAKILTGAPGYSGTYSRNMPPSQITAAMTSAAGTYWNDQLKEYCMPQGWRPKVK